MTKSKIKEGSRVMANGQEGMVCEILSDSNPTQYVVRHMCTSNLGPWDHFNKTYTQDELKPISMWLRIIRTFSPGNLTTFKY